MPNLNYDPRKPTDLIGQPIAEGDIVAWGTNWGRSAALCIAVIHHIRFYKEKPGSYSDKRIECDVADPDLKGYTLNLRPLKSTGDVTWVDALTGKSVYEYAWNQKSDKPFRDAIDDGEIVAKVKSIQHVKNVVKLDIPESQVR